MSLHDLYDIEPTYDEIFGRSDITDRRFYLQKRGSEKVKRKNHASLPVKAEVDPSWLERAKQSHQRLVKRAIGEK